MRTEYVTDPDGAMEAVVVRSRFGGCGAPFKDDPFWATPWSPLQVPPSAASHVLTHETHGDVCAAWRARRNTAERRR